MFPSSHAQVVDIGDRSPDPSVRTNAIPMRNSTPAWTPKAFKNALTKRIANLSKHLLLSFQENVEAFPDPGLLIDGVGPMPLPLYTTYTNALLEQGTGSISESWHLSDNSFKLDNTAWELYVTRQVEGAARTLKMEGPVSVGSCSLVLHRAGECSSNMSRACRKTAYASFATLTIVLPSQHEGGHIQVSHDNRAEVLETAATSKYGLTSLSWYSDTAVEYQPLVTGFRLMLVYGLNDESEKQEKQSPAALEASKMKLQKLLGLWSKDYDDHHHYNKKYIYILNKRCKSKTLDEDALEEPDKLLVKQISGLCSRNGFHIFLAQMEMRQCDFENSDMGGY